MREVDPVSAAANRLLWDEVRGVYVDALLADLSEEYGVPYVATSDLDLTYLDDRLHLTEDGHRAFGDAVAERIAALIPTRPAVLAG